MINLIYCQIASIPSEPTEYKSELVRLIPTAFTAESCALNLFPVWFLGILTIPINPLSCPTYKFVFDLSASKQFAETLGKWHQELLKILQISKINIKLISQNKNYSNDKNKTKKGKNFFKRKTICLNLFTN